MTDLLKNSEPTGEIPRRVDETLRMIKPTGEGGGRGVMRLPHTPMPAPVADVTALDTGGYPPVPRPTPPPPPPPPSKRWSAPAGVHPTVGHGERRSVRYVMPEGRRRGRLYRGRRRTSAWRQAKTLLAAYRWWLLAAGVLTVATSLLTLAALAVIR